ncbi:hypothetical protein ACFX13_041937 [Malus domestica]
MLAGDFKLNPCMGRSGSCSEAVFVYPALKLCRNWLDFCDTDESAVDDFISQAQDFCVLEQVFAISYSDFIDSLLPTELESHFRKLKSFLESYASR